MDAKKIAIEVLTNMFSLEDAEENSSENSGLPLEVMNGIISTNILPKVN